MVKIKEAKLAFTVLIVTVCTLVSLTVLLTSGDFLAPSLTSNHLRYSKNDDIVVTTSVSSYGGSNMVQHHSTGYSYQPYPYVFGFVHIAKTAGSFINSYLAAHYERVCGHKGYSYDSAAFYRRVNETIQHQLDQHRIPCRQVECNYGNDIIRRTYKDNYGRSRVPFEVMKEIGFEDCDYISLESPAAYWSTVATALESAAPLLDPPSTQFEPKSEEKEVHLQLHIPCRDPISHLMSQCNHMGVSFPCTTQDSNQWKLTIQKCMVASDRFNHTLWAGNPSLQLKCFDESQLDMYLEYMSRILQPRRRAVEEYVNLASNRPHNKGNDCLPQEKSAVLREEVRKYLMETVPYYSWCQDCLGGPDNLLT